MLIRYELVYVLNMSRKAGLQLVVVSELANTPMGERLEVMAISFVSEMHLEI